MDVRSFSGERKPEEDLDEDVEVAPPRRVVAGNLTGLEAGKGVVSFPGNTTLTGWVAQRKTGDGGGGGATATASGFPLPEKVRKLLEASLGADLSAVRIHVGPEATAIGARAYTRGTDIYFAPGQFDPDSAAGIRLLAHELTHVIQQSRGRVAPTRAIGDAPVNDDPSLEREADDAGDRAIAGVPAAAPAAIAAAPGVVAQRAPDPAADGAAPTLKWKTWSTAPGAGDDRFTLGPGEKVTFTGSKAGTWTASSGTPTTGESAETFDWTAPNTVGIYTIKLTVDGKDASQGMSVLAPTTITFKHDGEQHAGPGQAGVGLTLEQKVGPDNAAFDGIEIQEKPGGAATATGTFAKMPNAHKPNPNWTSIGNANKATVDDDAFAGPFDLPVEVGQLVWMIPVYWQPKGGGGGGSFAIVNQTMAIVDSKGTMTISKGGVTAKWTPTPKPGGDKKDDKKSADGDAGGDAAGGYHGGDRGLLRRAVVRAEASPGDALPGVLRQRFEQSLGQSLEDVRVHTGDASVAAADAAEARAFTLGRHIHFARGQYDPESPEGESLLAHEVAHTAQQGGDAGGELDVSSPADHAELEADRAIVPMLTGARTSVSRASGLARKILRATWAEVLPRLQAKDHDKNKRDQGVAKVDNTPGQAPSVNYDDKKSETQGGGADADVDAAVKAVITARGSIPARDVGRDPYSKKGNYYNPDKDKSGAADDYEAWRAKARPSVAYTAGEAKDEKKWTIFKQTWNLEGNPGIVTTFDKTLTIGVGFSSAGTAAEKVLGSALDQLPDIKAAAFAAGLAVQGGSSFDIVDTEKKVIVSGAVAAAYIQTVPALISLISNVIIGAQTDASGNKPDADAANKQRQAMLDAQWQAFLSGALSGIPDDILNWDISSVTLAVHTRHALQSTFPWAFLSGAGPGIENLVRAIYKKLKDTKQMGWFHAIVNGEYQAVANKVEQEDKPATPEEIHNLAKTASDMAMDRSIREMDFSSPPKESE